MVLDVLDIYKKIYEEILAIPIIKGIKSELGKLPGALYSTSLETISPINGVGVEAACSHNLGQNIAKQYEIYFQNQKHSKELAWQTTWEFSIKAIGLILLVHGDNRGAILPPKIAPVQVVLIPQYTRPFDKDKIVNKFKEIIQAINIEGLLTKIDDRTAFTPVWKHNYWEMKGVPIRIELGMKEMATEEVIFARRDIIDKKAVKWTELKKLIPETLDDIHKKMYENAKKAMTDTIVTISTWEQCMHYLKKGKACLAPWCRNTECENHARKMSKAELSKEAGINVGQSQEFISIFNIPFDSDFVITGSRCFACEMPALCNSLWGRIY